MTVSSCRLSRGGGGVESDETRQASEDHSLQPGTGGWKGFGR